jgi:hypothetical protein
MSNIISQHWTTDQEKLEEFVRHKTGKKEMLLLAAHLEKCDECNKRVQEERDLQAGIRRFGRLEMKRRLKLRLRRDRSRRFEWTHVASLAAAVVIVLGAVFAIRWFVDFKQEKPLTREIILSENKEEKPAERALWIIGKVIEISDESSQVASSVEEKQSQSFADNLNETPEPKVQNELKAGEMSRSRMEESPTKETEVTVMAERKAEVKDVATSLAKGEPLSIVRSDSESPQAAPAEVKENSKSIAQEKPEAGYHYSSDAVNSPRAMKMDKLKFGDTVGSAVKERLAQQVQTDSESLDKVSIVISDLKTQVPTYRPETKKVIPAPSKPASIAERKYDFRDQTSAKQKSLSVAKKRNPAKNIYVRRGDMKDLPASMIKYAPSAVHTRLERTSQGILLTFYSYEIKDTTATYIEAVTADSIIVFFRNKQIAYHIPGGLGGGT